MRTVEDYPPVVYLADVHPGLANPVKAATANRGRVKCVFDIGFTWPAHRESARSDGGNTAGLFKMLMKRLFDIAFAAYPD